MKRGDLVVAALAGDYGKPRPYVIVQADDMIGRLDSILACPLSTDVKDLSFRVTVPPGVETGLRQSSEILVNKLTPVPLARIAGRIGAVRASQMVEIEAALALVLGL